MQAAAWYVVRTGWVAPGCPRQNKRVLAAGGGWRRARTWLCVPCGFRMRAAVRRGSSAGHPVSVRGTTVGVKSDVTGGLPSLGRSASPSDGRALRIPDGSDHPEALAAARGHGARHRPARAAGLLTVRIGETVALAAVPGPDRGRAATAEEFEGDLPSPPRAGSSRRWLGPKRCHERMTRRYLAQGR